MSENIRVDENTKQRELDPDREQANDQYLTTNQGVPIHHTDDSLKAGERGPTLMQDFHFREKITHFDHERIPERVVHARGSGAYGYFQVYEPLTDLTRATFLQDPSVRTPVFVRFSTVAGSRGSVDTPRDVRGFATKFYTSDGVFDLVGNNIPIFFIQDAIKFPDLVHAIKPEPQNEMPQAATAHDTAWDFFSLLPESTHMVMWALSDRALPRSFRMMEGFGIHTFRLVNAQGISRFVKFHWKPLLGVHSLVWDEAQELAGRDPDWMRRDLWEAIEAGQYPEYEFGVQVLEATDEFSFPFDLLDPTKIWPEELVPVRRIGKMTLNRNPENFFAETEQVAFHPGHLVPGIDVTDDPLLQGRLFSYLDTQLSRLGSPNFAEIPINRSVAPVHNNQRDGFMRQTINTGRASYYPNSVGSGCPAMAPEAQAYMHFPQRVEGVKTRERSESFKDYFSQATLFWRSLSPVEQNHLVEAAHFELGKVEIMEIRQRMVGLFAHVDPTLAQRVAEGIGVEVPRDNPRPGVPPPSGRRMVEQSPALSMANTVKNTIFSRRVAILAADGSNSRAITPIVELLRSQGAIPMVIAPRLGAIALEGGEQVQPGMSLLTASSTFFDAVYVPDGQRATEQLARSARAHRFLGEAYLHGKTIAATGSGMSVLRHTGIVGDETSTGATARPAPGVVLANGVGDPRQFAEQFQAAIAQHRHWDRAPLTV